MKLLLKIKEFVFINRVKLVSALMFIALAVSLCAAFEIAHAGSIVNNFEYIYKIIKMGL